MNEHFDSEMAPSGALSVDNKVDKVASAYFRMIQWSGHRSDEPNVQVLL